MAYLAYRRAQHQNGPPEDSKSRSPTSGLQYSYGVDSRALRWIYTLWSSISISLSMRILKSCLGSITRALSSIYFLDPPKGSKKARRREEPWRRPPRCHPGSRPPSPETRGLSVPATLEAHLETQGRYLMLPKPCVL